LADSISSFVNELAFVNAARGRAEERQRMADLTVTIRDEHPEDHTAIHALTTAAFAPMPFSDGTEPDVITALRASGDLTLSLVAETFGIVAGHVAFSPATIAGIHDGWFALGPIAVKPVLQRQGIGRTLIGAGLGRLQMLQAKGCVLIGDPRYYGQFGFQGDGRLQHGGLDPALVQWVAFTGQPVPSGTLGFAPAFDLEAPQK
jgi:putative acetyltransferase